MANPPILANTLPVSGNNNLPPPQSPFVDPKTGVLSEDGYKFLINLINTIASTWPTFSVALGLAATGSTQATALALSSQWNVVTLIKSGTGGVILGTLQEGQQQTVFNAAGSPINVYPPPGVQIDNLGANVAYSLTNGSSRTFNFNTTTQIR